METLVSLSSPLQLYIRQLGSNHPHSHKNYTPSLTSDVFKHPQHSHTYWEPNLATSFALLKRVVNSYIFKLPQLSRYLLLHSMLILCFRGASRDIPILYALSIQRALRLLHKSIAISRIRRRLLAKRDLWGSKRCNCSKRDGGRS